MKKRGRPSLELPPGFFDMSAYFGGQPAEVNQGSKKQKTKGMTYDTANYHELYEAAHGTSAEGGGAQAAGGGAQAAAELEAMIKELSLSRLNRPDVQGESSSEKDDQGLSYAWWVDT